MEGLSSPRPGEITRDDTPLRRVPAPLSPPHAASGIPAHPLFRLSRQPSAQSTTCSVPPATDPFGNRTAAPASGLPATPPRSGHTTAPLSPLRPRFPDPPGSASLPLARATTGHLMRILPPTNPFAHGLAASACHGRSVPALCAHPYTEPKIVLPGPTPNRSIHLSQQPRPGGCRSARTPSPVPDHSIPITRFCLRFSSPNGPITFAATTARTPSLLSAAKPMRPFSVTGRRLLLLGSKCGP